MIDFRKPSGNASDSLADGAWKSDYAVPLTTQHALRNQLATEVAEIEELELAIKLAQSTLYALLSQKMQKLEHTAKIRSAIAPVKSLPVEILSVIFVDYMMGNYVAIPYRTPVDSPFVLCHVCSRWRRVALETPALWSDIRADFQFIHSDDYPRVTDTIREALSLSQPSANLVIIQSMSNRLMSVGAAIFSPPPTRRLGLTNLVMDLPRYCYRDFFILPPDTFRDLESVKLVFPSKLDRNIFDPFSQSCLPMTVFEGTRNLRRVVLEDVRVSKVFLTFPMSDSPLFLPYHQLEVLALNGIVTFFREAHELIRRSPNLLRCSFTIRPDPLGYSMSTLQRPWVLHSDQYIFHPKLELIRLQLHCEATRMQFLHPLELPALSSLQFISHPGWDMDSFKSTFSHSKCYLARHLPDNGITTIFDSDLQDI